MNCTKSQDKIMRVLKKMDEVMAREGFFQYQERIHRIYKTMLSIERHGDCIVSNFSLNGNEDDDQNYNQTENHESNYLSVVTEDNFEIEEDDKTSTKYEIDDILSFIEDELKMKKLFSISNSTSSASSDDEIDEFSKMGIKKKKSYNKEKIQKKFFNIELRLRAYLKETTMFNQANFDSFLNESKLRTPLSKLNPSKAALPTIMKNFFMDKSIVEEAKKRYSVREDLLKKQIELMGNSEEMFKCKSTYVNLSCKRKPPKKEETSITNFSIDMNSDNNSVGNTNRPSLENLNLSKRDSIFKERYFCDFGIVEEENDIDDTNGRNSDTSYNSQFEGEN